MAERGVRDADLTAEVLRLRQREESEALAALKDARQALERALTRLQDAEAEQARCQQAESTAEQAFLVLRGELLAGVLRTAADQLRQRQEQRQRAALAVQQAQAELERGQQALDAAHQGFLQRRGQREAAELFATREQAAKRRQRMSRMRGIEEEARDRFASAKQRRPR